MAGIGDEALLLLVALCDRLNDAAGEVQDDEEHNGQAEQRSEYAGSQECAERSKRSAAVEEGDLRGASFGLYGIAEVFDEARSVSRSEGLLGVLNGAVLIYRRYPLNICILHISAAVCGGNEKSGLLCLIT